MPAAVVSQEQLREVFEGFQISGQFCHAEALNVGHINETYAATYNRGSRRVRYVHQKINTNVFKNPAGLMKNLVRVTTHLRRKLEAQNVRDLSRRCLTVIPTREGRWFLQRGREVWRTFEFIEGARTYEAADAPKQAWQAGRAFGQFQSALVVLPGGRLVETIPDFHHTRKRFRALEQAIDRDCCNRATKARLEIEFALKHEPVVDVILEAIARKKIPERITHNDPKFNNVMLDIRTGEAMCVVDLDTVMPGSVLYDFGDMVRTTTSPAREDERDLSKVKMQMPMFRKIAEGYLRAAGGFLTRAEKSYMAFSGKLITFEMGIRFLADFLNGDVYYRTHRPGQNLDRCHTQFRLVKSIERQEERMQKVVNGL